MRAKIKNSGSYRKGICPNFCLPCYVFGFSCRAPQMVCLSVCHFGDELYPDETYLFFGEVVVERFDSGSD